MSTSSKQLQAGALFVGLVLVAGGIVAFGLTGGASDDTSLANAANELAPTPTPSLGSVAEPVNPTSTEAAADPVATPGPAPTTAVSDATPALDLALPAGHEAFVLELPSIRAVGGLIRSGDNVTVVATSAVESGTASSFVIGEVEVVDARVVIDLDDLDENGLLMDSADDPLMAITVAVTPDESAAVSDAIVDGEIRLAAAVDRDGYYGMAVRLSRTQALDGAIRYGDIVTVVSAGEPVLRDISVHEVRARLPESIDATPDFFVVVLGALPEDLPELATAVTTGDITLAPR